MGNKIKESKVDSWSQPLGGKKLWECQKSVATEKMMIKVKMKMIIMRVIPWQIIRFNLDLIILKLQKAFTMNRLRNTKTRSKTLYLSISQSVQY